MALAKTFQPPVILSNKSGAGTLRAAATKIGIPNILVEPGEALRFHDGYIEECTKGIMRVMHHLGMIEDAPESCVEEPVIVKETAWLRARRGGFFHAGVRLGDCVEKGQVLGKVTDVHGDYQGKIPAPKKGLVIAVLKNPLVYKGDAMIHIAHTPD